jgi:hypothetical protein
VNKILTFLIVICVFLQASAQIKFEQNPFEKAEPFEYQSVRNSFWKEIDQQLKQGMFDEALALAFSQETKSLKLNEKAEVYLAVAEIAVRTGHPYIATMLAHEITHIFPLSNQAIRSYFLLEEILRKHAIYDEFIIGETIIEQDINFENKKIPGELRGFLGYLFFQSHRAQNFTKWEAQAKQFITPNTEWAFRLEYDRALYELYNDRFDEALKIFDGLMNNELASDYLRKKAKRQYARLIFEKGEFQKSFQMLKSLQFEQDDRGSILLERAWTKYYLKHYSKALGLLTALDAKLFDSSRTPETEILKMLIFKELCHYDSVFDIKKRFDRRYKSALQDIKLRKDLSKNREIMQLALQRPALKNYSAFIGGLRQDFQWLKKKATNGQLMEDLQTKVALQDKQMQDILSLKIRDQLRKSSNDLLDWNEQVNFLDYQTRVDSLRIRRSDKELNYRPEAIPLITFDRLYWLYKGEVWLDEIENLRVLVTSRCQKTK